MKIVEVFPLLADIHRVKDPATVLMHLQRRGAAGEILTYRKDTLHQQGFPRLRYVGRPFPLAAMRWLATRGKHFDVLLLFHSHPMNFFYAVVYQWARPDGIVVVKADMDNTILGLRQFSALNIIRRVKILANLFVADIFSVEHRPVFEFLRNGFPRFARKLHYMPNGIGDVPRTPVKPFKEKKNIILVVGPVGSRQKATDIAFDVLRRVSKELSDWKVVFAGEVLDEFRPRAERFKLQHPNIEFRGFVRDRREMIALYNDAKILFVPSRWEGFPISVSEAAYFGDVIVGTAVGGVVDVTGDGAHGGVCPVGDAACLARELRKRLSSQRLLEEEGRKTRTFFLKHCMWEHTIPKLEKRIGTMQRTKSL